MWQAIEHEGYQIEMEVLASLPKAPHTARLRDLAQDFGFGNARPIRAILANLRTRYGVRLIAGHQTEACIAEESWDRAREAAERYWARVYEDEGVMA